MQVHTKNVNRREKAQKVAIAHNVTALLLLKQTPSMVDLHWFADAFHG